MFEYRYVGHIFHNHYTNHLGLGRKSYAWAYFAVVSVPNGVVCILHITPAQWNSVADAHAFTGTSEFKLPQCSSTQRCSYTKGLILQVIQGYDGFQDRESRPLRRTMIILLA